MEYQDLCPACGAPLGSDSPDVCAKCGWKREQAPEACIDGYPEELISSYVFYNADTYLKKFRKIAAGKRTFHWPAFFVGNLWFAYRKMYKEAVVLTLLLLIALPVVELLLVLLLAQFLPPLAVILFPYLFSLLAGVVVSMAANPLYFRAVKKQIDIRREEERTSGGALDARERLAYDSPTSVGAVFAFIGVNVVFKIGRAHV